MARGSPIWKICIAELSPWMPLKPTSGYHCSRRTGLVLSAGSRVRFQGVCVDRASQAHRSQCFLVSRQTFQCGGGSGAKQDSPTLRVGPSSQ